MVFRDFRNREAVSLPRSAIRLADVWGWNLPIPEFVMVILGIVVQILVPGQRNWAQDLASLFLLGGVVALFVGIPLVFFTLRSHVADVAFISVGAVAFWYANTDAAESNGWVYILLFPSFGFMAAGASHLFRRSIARALSKR